MSVEKGPCGGKGHGEKIPRSDQSNGELRIGGLRGVRRERGRHESQPQEMFEKRTGGGSKKKGRAIGGIEHPHSGGELKVVG